MGRSARRRNPFAFLFAATRRDQFVERYVLREYRKGRPLAEILEEPYIRAWSTPEERAKLLERPAVVAAIGEHAIAELTATVDPKMGPPTHWRERRSSAPSQTSRPRSI